MAHIDFNVCIAGLESELGQRGFAVRSIDPHNLHTFLNAAAHGPVGKRRSGYSIFVKMLTGEILAINDINPGLTVDAFKVEIQECYGIPPVQQCLIYSGRILEDNRTLADYNIYNGCTLHLILRMWRGGESKNLRDTIDASLLDPSFDFDFSAVDDKAAGRWFDRGGFAYLRPCGWKRFALKVKGRYGCDGWLGDQGFRLGASEGEWPVSYHGTALCNSSSIAQDGYKLSKGLRFLYGRGIYSSPDPDVAAKYAREFQHEGGKFQIMFQNRVNPSSLQRIDGAITGSGEYWISPSDDDVRPYGFLVREVPR